MYKQYIQCALYIILMIDLSLCACGIEIRIQSLVEWISSTSRSALLETRRSARFESVSREECRRAHTQLT